MSQNACLHEERNAFQLGRRDPERRCAVQADPTDAPRRDSSDQSPIPTSTQIAVSKEPKPNTTASGNQPAPRNAVIHVNVGTANRINVSTKGVVVQNHQNIASRVNTMPIVIWNTFRHEGAVDYPKSSPDGFDVPDGCQ